MKLFKKKIEEKSWNDLTLRDLMKIRDIAQLQIATEDEKNIRVAAIVNKVDYDKLLEMPLAEMRTYMDQTEFLLHKPVPAKTRNTYTLNNHTYKLFKHPADMTIAQYIDFQAIYEEGFEKRPAELLSIILIPKGHEYNDGYDREQVVEDMYELSVPEGLGICDFFMRQYIRSIKAGLMYCRVMAKLMKIMPGKNREKYKAQEIQVNLIAKELECIYGSPAFKL